jgi:hypothetical protein
VLLAQTPKFAVLYRELVPTPSGAATSDSLGETSACLSLQYVVRLDAARTTLVTEVWVEVSADPKMTEVIAAALEKMAAEVCALSAKVYGSTGLSHGAPRTVRWWNTLPAFICCGNEARSRTPASW